MRVPARAARPHARLPASPGCPAASVLAAGLRTAAPGVRGAVLHLVRAVPGPQDRAAGQGAPQPATPRQPRQQRAAPQPQRRRQADLHDGRGRHVGAGGAALVAAGRAAEGVHRGGCSPAWASPTSERASPKHPSHTARTRSRIPGHQQSSSLPAAQRQQPPRVRWHRCLPAGGMRLERAPPRARTPPGAAPPAVPAPRHRRATHPLHGAGRRRGRAPPGSCSQLHAGGRACALLRPCRTHPPTRGRPSVAPAATPRRRAHSPCTPALHRPPPSAHARRPRARPPCRTTSRLSGLPGACWPSRSAARLGPPRRTQGTCPPLPRPQ